ncbi:MAG: translation initiation factor IF-2, partial [Puniceicoccaceae bacterium]
LRPPGVPPPPPGSVASRTENQPEEAGSSPAAAPEGGEEIKTIVVKPPIVVKEFANELGIKPFKLISELMEMGIFASMNQSLEESVASEVAAKHGFLLDVRHRGDSTPQQPKKKEVPKIDEALLMEPRPPVVCILGHVDHGKTSLLDRIRSANVAEGEAGGITQHIGAYQVERADKRITFLDTPGHSAFNKMRARGANATDIAVLVVAADDGFMPQTDEALKYIQQAGVALMVAINKIDTKGANIDRVKSQMQERNIAPEDWGGEVIAVPVSAIQGDGVDDLLEMILLQADLLELKANPKRPAAGLVIEAQVEVGRGSTATVLVQSGTLKVGDALVCGPCYTKVKAMFDHAGKPVREAGPSTPVRVIGWSDTPECGQPFEAVKNEREAKRLAEENAFEQKRRNLAAPEPKPVSAESLFEAIAATQAKVLRVIIKGDVYGSVEAVVSALEAIESSKVKLEVVHSEVGAVSRNDVLTASAAEASVIAFNVKLESGVDAVAKHHGVSIITHRIIYELIDGVRDAMAELLEPEVRETKLGSAEIRAVFPVAKGFVAGGLVTEGRMVSGSKARLLRKGQVVHESRLGGLRRVKDEVKEVRAGTECGMMLDGCQEYQVGDQVECFETQLLRPSL